MNNVRPAAAEKHQGDVLLISPHLDDAVLSCEEWVGRSESIDVLTVFCARPSPRIIASWDQSAGFDDSDQAISARILEDEAAFVDTPHRRHNLQLLDNQYLRGSRSSEDAEILLRWIDDWLDGATSPLVLIPVGAGLRPIAALAGYPTLARLSCGVERRLRSALGLIFRTGATGHPPHVDHEWISWTVSEHFVESGVKWGFYTEVPYVFGGDGRRAVSALLGRDRKKRVHRVEIPVDRAIKARRVAAYRSQVPLIADRGTPLEEWLPPMETYWFVNAGHETSPLEDRAVERPQ